MLNHGASINTTISVVVDEPSTTSFTRNSVLVLGVFLCGQFVQRTPYHLEDLSIDGGHLVGELGHVQISDPSLVRDFEFLHHV